MTINTEKLVNSIYSGSNPPVNLQRKQMNISSKSGQQGVLANSRYEVANLKQSLESWKLVLVSLNNLIEWNGKFDPVIIVSLDTLVFGLLMFYSPSILSTVSIIGITMLVIEILLPILINYMFKNSEWDAESEEKYTHICKRISHLYEHYVFYRSKLEGIKKERQSLYFLIVLFFLLFCAYVGQCVDNFLLTYLAVLVMTLTPGARRHNLKDKAVGQVKHLLSMKKKSGSKDE